MKRVPVESLNTTVTLLRPLYHECGALLFAAGDRIADEELALLRKSGIKRLYDLGDGDPSAAPGEDTTTATLPAEPQDLPDEVRRFRRDRRAAAALRVVERVAASRLPPERTIADPRGELRNGGIERAIERSRAGEAPEGPPWRDRVDALAAIAPRSAREKEEALELRARSILRLSSAFAAIRGGGAPATDDMREAARDILVLVARDPSAALALAHEADRPPVSGDDEAGALARHGWSVAVFALGTAVDLGYALEQLFELAHAAPFHDVGMLRLPAAIAAKTTDLDEEERKELQRHPVHAMEILRRFAEVPLALAAIACDEHERLDGSGYPRGAEPGDFARIVAAADVYAALVSSRPYRPGRLPHAAVREIVQLAAKKKLDTRMVRALMKALSLFPVGSWAKTSDGQTARVVRAGPDPSRPLLAIVSGEPLAVTGLLDLAQRPDLRIAEPIPAPADAAPLLGF